MDFCIISFSEYFLLVIHGHQVLIAGIFGIRDRFEGSDFIERLYGNAALAYQRPGFSWRDVDPTRFITFPGTGELRQWAKIKTIDDCALGE
ncbi:hypothetical protein D3C85_1624550 [compost metagenome]